MIPWRRRLAVTDTFSEFTYSLQCQRSEESASLGVLCQLGSKGVCSRVLGLGFLD